MTDRLGHLPGVALAWVMALVLGHSVAAAAPSPPNIVFILADDLGYGDLGSYGSQTIATPRLDQLAREGLSFTDFYATSPVCSPSRAAFLTGRYPVRQGIHQVFFEESWGGLPPGETIIPELLRQAGYVSGMVGKWHLGHRHKYLPLQQGFDEFFGVPYSNDMGGFFYIRGNEAMQENVDQTTLTQTFTREAVAFIRRHRQRPFFLYLAHSMPHTPLHPSASFAGTSAGGRYGDVVEELDASVGTLLDALAELGLSDRTLVVFTSDNGPWRLMGSLGGSTGGLRGAKANTFDGGMKVPAIARWPGVIEAGDKYRGVSSLLDWLPTFAELAGVSPAADLVLDGESLAPVLTGSGERVEPDLAYFANGRLEAYRSGDWKLKLPYTHPWFSWAWLLIPGEPRAHDWMLFNVRRDPGERDNVFAEQPQRVAAMKEKVAAFETSLGDLPPAQLTGKNTDYSGFVHALGLILLRLLALVVVAVVLGVLLYRLVCRGLGARRT